MRASAPGQSALRIGDVDDPIPGLLEIGDRYGNRVDLLLGLRGMDPELLNRTRQVRFGETVLAIAGREDFIAMKAFAGGPVDLANARVVIELDRGSLHLELLRRLAQRFGRDAARVVEDLLGAVDGWATLGCEGSLQLLGSIAGLRYQLKERGPSWASDRAAPSAPHHDGQPAHTPAVVRLPITLLFR